MVTQQLPQPAAPPALAPEALGPVGWAARALCLVLALLGLVPPTGALLSQTAWFEVQAARLTAQLLEQQLGLKASYSLKVSAFPLWLELNELELQTAWEPEPWLVAQRARIEPSLVALLAGVMHVEHVQIEGLRVKLTLDEEGKPQQLASLGEAAPASSSDASAWPLSSLHLDHAEVSLRQGPTQARMLGVSLRLAALSNGGQATLGIESTRIDSWHDGRRGKPGAYRDSLCNVSVHARYEQGTLLVPRLTLSGWIDADAGPASAPSCSADPLAAPFPQEAPPWGGDAHPLRLALLDGSLSLPHAASAPSHNGPGPELSTRKLDLRLPLSLVDRYFVAPKLGALRGDVRLRGALQRGLLSNASFSGFLESGWARLGKQTIVRSAEGDIRLQAGQVASNELIAHYAGGEVRMTEIALSLRAPSLPIRVGHAATHGLSFPELMKDIAVTPNTIVAWDFGNLAIADFRGTLIPTRIAGQLEADTRGFEVFDRAYHDQKRAHVVGVAAAHVSSLFGVRGREIRFDALNARFGESQVLGAVQLGFDGTVDVRLVPGSRLQLGDISPISSLPWKGLARLDTHLSGPGSDPILTGRLDIEDFSFAGFPLGSLHTDSLGFRPLAVTADRLELTKGTSGFVLSDATLDFDAGPTLLAEARIEPTDMALRDLLALFKLDRDPRWQTVDGQGRAKGRLSYVVGGPRDRCGSGDLRVSGELTLDQLELFGEHFSDARSEFSMHWFDPDASYRGMELRLPNATARMGSGDLLGRLSVTRGGFIEGHGAASHVPLGALSTLRPLGSDLHGHWDAIGQLGGSLDALSGSYDASVGPVGLGGRRLAPSRLNVALKPTPRDASAQRKTPCGIEVPTEYDPSAYEADRSSGNFIVSGSLFGGHLTLEQLHFTQQRARHVYGKVRFSEFDLYPFLPRSATAGLQRTALSGQLSLDDLPLATPALTQGRLALSRLQIKAQGLSLESQAPADLRMSGGQVVWPETAFELRAPAGQRARFSLLASLSRLDQAPQISLEARLPPTRLAGFSSMLPNAQRVAGTLGGNLSLRGPLLEPAFRGGVQLKNGAIAFQGMPAPVTDLNLDLELDAQRVRLTAGRASYGNGTIEMSGEAALQGFRVGAVRGQLQARRISLAPAPGVSVAGDAELDITWQPGADDERDTLPRVTGEIALTEARYERPVQMSISLRDLAQRGRRTQVEAYQAGADWTAFDLTVRFARPIELDNNLISATLGPEQGGLRVVGTNQRFGAEGNLRLLPGGRLRLRGNEFEIQRGRVRFEDPTRVAPLVDVTAVTEYRRYGVSLDQASGALAQGRSGASSDYRVTLRAHGNADTLQVDLSSEPQLSEDDIFLLLTLGLTGTELDQLQQGGGRSNVALEALGALTGADQAVTEALGVIDEFRLGSAYSSRRARTEPTITIGKRLSQRIRAFVTTGLSESRDVRSNVEVRINPRVSVEGSYDNLGTLSNSTVGNLGANLRWRLRFE